MKHTTFSPILLALCVGGAILRTPTGAAAPPSPTGLEISGAGFETLHFSAEKLARISHQTVRARDHEGTVAEFEGIPLHALLAQAGVKFGNELRGPALASYLVVEAADGYRVVFALPELDPACTDRVILLADRRDGKPLNDKEGPLRLVVSGEKRHIRWVRQVVALRLGQA